MANGSYSHKELSVQFWNTKTPGTVPGFFLRAEILGTSSDRWCTAIVIEAQSWTVLCVSSCRRISLTQNSKLRASCLKSIARLGRSLWRRTTAFGLRYTCPICHANLRQFLPGGENQPILIENSVVGGGLRPNVFCPVCRSRDRERLVYLYLTRRPHLLAKGTKLLHVAPETNLRAWLRSNVNLDYVTADLKMSKVDFRLDLTMIPFLDSIFDGIICNHVLEHIPDDLKAMAELARILKPGGWAILQVPISSSLEITFEEFSITDPTEREIAFGQHDHVRIYGLDYLDRLKRSGFFVAPFSWSTSKKEYGGNINRFGLSEREKIFFASKCS